MMNKLSYNTPEKYNDFLFASNQTPNLETYTTNIIELLWHDMHVLDKMLSQCDSHNYWINYNLLREYNFYSFTDYDFEHMISNNLLLENIDYIIVRNSPLKPWLSSHWPWQKSTNTDYYIYPSVFRNLLERSIQNQSFLNYHTFLKQIPDNYKAFQTKLFNKHSSWHQFILNSVTWFKNILNW